MKKNHKWIPIIGLAAGALMTGHGMISGNHIIFIAGIALIICGYIMIRQKLKGSENRRTD